MPSAITIVTTLFLYSALLFLFGVCYYQLLSRRQTRKALVKIVDQNHKGCMVWRKQPVNEDRIFW
jgi:hypothetical protein